MPNIAGKAKVYAMTVHHANGSWVAQLVQACDFPSRPRIARDAVSVCLGCPSSIVPGG